MPETRQILFFSILLLLFPLQSFSQTQPVYNVPSPEVANLGQFAAIPVGLYTGVPQISVPLYTVRLGGKEHHISADYHLASVKPNRYPGAIGLGWSLQCGGVITRTVRGVYDEKKGMSGDGNGYYWNRSEMSGISNAHYAYTTANSLMSEIDDWHELSADEFSFNFFGYSGNFYLAPDGNWVVLSDQDIKVEFDQETGFGSYDALGDRIPKFDRWPGRITNTIFFKEFTIITPDGYRYRFGGNDAIDFSISYYSRATSDLIATSWYLKEVTAPDGRKITYTYTHDALMVDLRYIPMMTVTSGLNMGAEYASSVNTGRKGFNGFLLFPVNVSSISTPNEQIDFDYDKDRQYSDAYQNYCGDALYWSEQSFIRRNAFLYNMSDPSFQFGLLFPDISGDSDRQKRASIASSLRANVLRRITISPKHDGGDTSSVYFSYFNGARRKLKSICWRAGIEDDITYVMGEGILYPVYHIPANTSGADMPEYNFVYNPGQMPTGYVFPQTDRWGYYNGLQHRLSGSYVDTNPAQSTYFTKFETLSEMIYPTGGIRSFEYESNTYSRIEKADHIHLDRINGTSGGLRIRSITDMDRQRKVLSKKLYHYGEERGHSDSGVAKVLPPTVIVYTVANRGDDGMDLSLTIKSRYGFDTPVTGINAPDVGYSCVIEETLDSIGTSLGYVRSRFSNYDTDLYGSTHHDRLAHFSCNGSAEENGCPYTSNAEERGKLLSREWFTPTDSLVKYERYWYARVGNDSLLTATQRIVYLSTDPSRLRVAAMGWLTYTHLYSYMPVRTETMDGGYTKTSEVGYNGSKLPCTISIASSKDTLKLHTDLKYPSDFPTECGWLLDRHIVSPVVLERHSIDGHSRTIRTTYGLPKVSVPFVSKVEKSSDDAPFDVKYEVHHADIYGNPTDISEDGCHTVLVWGRCGECLYQRVTNITMSEYNALPVVTNSTGNMLIPEIPEQRNTSGHQCYDYSYDGNLRLKSVAGPDGVTVHYDYDPAGRLSREYYIDRDGDGNTSVKVIRQYGYHYYNGGPGND